MNLCSQSSGYGNLSLKSLLCWEQLNHTCRPWFDPWVRKITWRRAWQPTPVFLPGESHGQRSLVSYSPWGSQSVRHDWSNRACSEQTKSDNLGCTKLYLMEVLGLILTYDFTNTARYVICILPVLPDCCFLHYQSVTEPLIKSCSSTWDQWLL